MTSETDADGLPFPDQETLAALRAEALTSLPDPRDWADLVAMLIWIRETERSGAKNPELPDGMTSIQKSIALLCAFLAKQDVLMKRNAVSPLIRLNGAIVDLADGRTSPLFKPVNAPSHSPGKKNSEATVMGLAARAMSDLIEAGMPLKDAARKVAAAVPKRFGAKATNVENWRERMMLGHGPGAPKLAVQTYQKIWGDAGGTSAERAKHLLHVLKTRIDAMT